MVLCCCAAGSYDSSYYTEQSAVSQPHEAAPSAHTDQFERSTAALQSVAPGRSTIDIRLTATSENSDKSREQPMELSLPRSGGGVAVAAQAVR